MEISPSCDIQQNFYKVMTSQCQKNFGFFYPPPTPLVDDVVVVGGETRTSRGRSWMCDGTLAITTEENNKTI
jgi:hypothetical protein